jgi:hypothetical protein
MLCMGGILDISVLVYTDRLRRLAMDFEYNRRDSTRIVFHF